MASLFDSINRAERDFDNLVPIGSRLNPDSFSPEAKAADEVCRSLHDDLRKAFEEPLSRYNDGLITGKELLLFLTEAAFKE